MKFILLLATLFLCLFQSMPLAKASWARMNFAFVPVERMLSNLESRRRQASTNPERAMLEFQIGRLHSMAYASKTEEVKIRKADEHQPIDEPFYGYYHTDFTQFDVTQATSPEVDIKAHEHLEVAIKHLNKALVLDSSLDRAKLGLAWCLDQAGKKTDALKLYREVFKVAWEKEKEYKTGMRGSSVAQETGGYLLNLLTPAENEKEIADLKSKCEQLDAVFRMITPILVPIAPGLQASQLLAKTKVTFDLDGTGPRTYEQWPSRMAGWLVFDDGGASGITSGLQMFGQCTFWIFWRNGYEAMASLDDDQNGKLEKQELDRLSLWQDNNHNGVCDKGEVRNLASLGIESLSCRSSIDQSGTLFSREGVTFSSGRRAATYDWILKESR